MPVPDQRGFVIAVAPLRRTSEFAPENNLSGAEETKRSLRKDRITNRIDKMKTCFMT
jgi:hypothetical protein